MSTSLIACPFDHSVRFPTLLRFLQNRSQMHYFTYSADVTRCPRTNFTKWMISSRTREVLSVIPRSSKSRLLGLTWIHPGNLSPNLPLPARTHCLWTLIGNWTNTCWLVLDLVDNWAGEPCSGVLGYIHRRIKMAYVTTVISHLLCAGGINIGLCDFLFPLTYYRYPHHTCAIAG